MLIASVMFFGCDNKKQEVEDAKKEVEKAKMELAEAEAEYKNQWTQFKYDAELKIKANEIRIAEFKVIMKTTGNKFKAKYEKEILLLEQKNQELKDSINNFKYNSKSNWEEFKTSFNRDLDAVGQSLKEVFERKD